MYKIELNERELYLVLQAIGSKMVHRRQPGYDNNYDEHKTLHDKLEMIFEGRN